MTKMERLVKKHPTPWKAEKTLLGTTSIDDANGVRVRGENDYETVLAWLIGQVNATFPPPKSRKRRKVKA